MKTDFLIIGQGIAGTLLSYKLMKAGFRVMVIDEGSGGKASRVAGAVINPLSGKDWKPAPDAGLFIPAALACYHEMEELLQQQLIRQLPLYIFQHDPSNDFTVLQPAAETEISPYFFTSGKTNSTETWLVDANALLNGWAEYLQQQDALMKETFRFEDCTIRPDKVLYKRMEAAKIIFCEGAAGRQNSLFSSLPFTRNRGEALLLRIPLLPDEALYHRKLRLVPRSDSLFWCGSNYQWNFNNLDPDPLWKETAVQELESWLRLPFEIADHIVAERPTTAGQIPLIGIHPRQPAVALLNGLGTRGFSSGPFWAGELSKQLADPGYGIAHYRQDWFRKQFR